MYDSGIGVSQLNTLLSALNSPAIESSTMRRYEKHIAGTIETVALESCEEEILIERKLELEYQSQQ